MDIGAVLVFIMCIVCVCGVGYVLYTDSAKSKKKMMSKNSNTLSKKSKAVKNANKVKSEKNGKTDKNNKNIKILDSQDLLDFGEIIVFNEETAILRYDEDTFIGYINVRGINFNLMSIDERINLEESFGELLNGIDFPIQLYTQSRRIDLDDYLNKYQERIDEIKNQRRIMEERGASEEDIRLITNQIEYGEKLLVYYTQRTVNSDLKDRMYYVVVKYVHSSESFEHQLSEQEILSNAYSDIQNKAALIIDSLLRNNLTSKILSAIEIGEMLYAAYNRCDSSKLKFRNAVEAGFNHLFTTAQPVELKKLEREIIKSEEKEMELLNEMEEIRKEMGA
ncbi:hypothetical protein OD350_29085 (plasmid) [Clostridium beijerinckii]|uniref:hypothetical protein n=1 Tax=Clostridium beijerinckii TaxID=1520 RepID=UPI0022264C8C|nr:hypothetical protein [Clostridium beijerinckii]UYZ38944.1 hypothetical protein OD350_29085 [Clostridium beijerinckii]